MLEDVGIDNYDRMMNVNVKGVYLWLNKVGRQATRTGSFDWGSSSGAAHHAGEQCRTNCGDVIRGRGAGGAECLNLRRLEVGHHGASMHAGMRSVEKAMMWGWYLDQTSQNRRSCFWASDRE